MPDVAAARLPVFKLLVLAGAIFVSVTSEFLPTGVMPEISEELDVSESQVGLLVAIFAGTVALTAAPLSILTRRFSRKWLLVVVLGIFAITNVLCAIAPTYELLAAARVAGGLAHGLFWAVVGPYASYIVPRAQLARANAITTTGGTMAFILGVPAGAAIGHAVGWRLAFIVMAVAVVVFVVLAAILLPPVKHGVQLATGEIALPVRRDRSLGAVLIVGMTVLLIATGHNLFYVYIAPWTISVGGVPPELVSVALFFYGIAGAIGVVAVAMFGDRAPRMTLNLMTGSLILAIVVLGATGNGLVAVVVGLVLWSASFGGLPAMFSTRALHSASARVRDVSGAVVTTSFNVAIGAGALLGGFVVDGPGLAAVPWFAAAIVVIGLAWVLLTDRWRIRLHPAEAHRG